MSLKIINTDGNGGFLLRKISSMVEFQKFIVTIEV